MKYFIFHVQVMVHTHMPTRKCIFSALWFLVIEDQLNNHRGHRSWLIPMTKFKGIEKVDMFLILLILLIIVQINSRKLYIKVQGCMYMKMLIRQIKVI